MGYLNVLINRISKFLIRRSQESKKNRNWKVGTQVKITSALRAIPLDIFRADGDSIKSVFLIRCTSFFKLTANSCIFIVKQDGQCCYGRVEEIPGVSGCLD